MLPERWRELADRLASAQHVARQAAEGMRDGGSCNLDSVFLCGIRWCRDLESALDVSGVRWKRRRRFPRGVYLYPGGGQGAARTKAAEVMAGELRRHGYDAIVWYVVD